MRKRVLVVGGTGFVGSHIAEQLAAAGYDVRSLARRLPTGPAPGDIDYRVGDLAQRADVAQAFADVDAAVFAVTTTTPSAAQQDPTFDRETNLAAGASFLAAVRAAQIGRVVLISSGGTVYGMPRSLPIPETHPTNPISSYGTTKLALEKLFAHELGRRLTILRVGNAYGERQDASRGQGAPAAFLAALLADRPVEIWGDGSVVRDYVYAGDVGSAVVCLLRRGNGDSPLVLNIGSGRGSSLRDLLRACGHVVGIEPRPTYMEGRAFDVPSIVLDASSAAAELSWRAETALEVGLERAAAWLVSERQAIG